MESFLTSIIFSLVIWTASKRRQSPEGKTVNANTVQTALFTYVQILLIMFCRW